MCVLWNPRHTSDGKTHDPCQALAQRRSREVVRDSFAARFDAIIFDKDGTLLDFSATWDPNSLCHRVFGRWRRKLQEIASTLGLDMEKRTCSGCTDRSR